MAISLIEKYPGRTGPANADYPYGSVKNESAPGANDGTPLEQAWGNDLEGFFQALLSRAEVTPSGIPDTATVSQRLLALQRILSAGVTTVSASRALTVADAGLVLVDASGAPVALTLPAADALGDIRLRYTFVRLDATANTVTITRSGSDTIEGATNVVLSAARPKLILEANGVDAWHDLMPQASQSDAGVVRLADAETAIDLIDALRVITPETLGAAMNAHVLGMGQTWQDVTEERAWGTTYTNTTGRSIAVYILTGRVNGGVAISLTIDGVTLIGPEFGDADGHSRSTSIFAIIPPGAEYSATSNRGVFQWAELR